MSRLLLLGPAREAAGVGQAEVDGGTLADVIANANARFGVPFAEIVARSRMWVNGEDAPLDHAVGPTDEIAVVPPVSGG